VNFSLETFFPVPNICILVAGGDGTVAWVLLTIDRLNENLTQAERHSPPIAVLPLGTGNDLSRTLMWGGGYHNGQKLWPILKSIQDHVNVILLDRWSIAISSTSEPSQDMSLSEGHLNNEMVIPKYRRPPVMNNYLSVGIDAWVAFEFHSKREARPEKFNSRILNKLNYAKFGTKGLFRRFYIRNFIELEVDGSPVEIPGDAEGLIILNVDSYMGGSDLWGTKEDKKFRQPSIDDQLLELVTVNGVAHLGAIAMNFTSAHRLSQGREIKINITKSEIPIQIDGEPWIQPPYSMIMIKHLNQASMLSRDLTKKILILC